MQTVTEYLNHFIELTVIAAALAAAVALFIVAERLM